MVESYLGEVSQGLAYHIGLAHWTGGLLKFKSCLEPLVGQKLTGHGDLDPITLGIGFAFDRHIEVNRAHDAVAELFIDESLPGWAVALD